MTDKKVMTLRETKEIILKWINSCNTNEQLDLLEPVILNQWLPRFDIFRSLTYELIMAKEDLVNAISDRRNIIVKHNPEVRVPTLDSYLDDLIN